MKGLRRNVKYLSGMLLNLQIVVYLTLLLTFALLSLGEMDPLTKFAEEMSIYLVLITYTLILLGVGVAEYSCRTMVFLGSARKPAAVGILLSVHTFLVLQMVILFGLATFMKNSILMQVIRSCPLGIIALLLVIMGAGLLVITLSLRGHMVCVGIIVVTLTVVNIVLMVVISEKFAVGVSKELLMPYNSVWLLLVGLVVDLAGVFVYYKTVTKVDLKLA